MFEILCFSEVDCEVRGWSRWSPCSTKCGVGSQERTRSVSVMPDNGGNSCPVLEESRPCQGYMCGRRRVGRSGSRMMRYMDVSSGTFPNKRQSFIFSLVIRLIIFQIF